MPMLTIYFDPRDIPLFEKASALNGGLTSTLAAALRAYLEPEKVGQAHDEAAARGSALADCARNIAKAADLMKQLVEETRVVWGIGAAHAETER